jgi:hypothetical protein
MFSLRALSTVSTNKWRTHAWSYVVITVRVCVRIHSAYYCYHVVAVDREPSLHRSKYAFHGVLCRFHLLVVYELSEC